MRRVVLPPVGLLPIWAKARGKQLIKTTAAPAADAATKRRRLIMGFPLCARALIEAAVEFDVK
jgi:hypothetical protein